MTSGRRKRRESQEALLHEVEFAAKLGVDVFNMDASWYLGSSKRGTGDWGCGLGHYSDDLQKYPLGLASISHRVHEVGMKFGLWVGPNVVDSRIFGTTIPKLWGAEVDGKEQILQPSGWESSVHQACLGCREYIGFLKRELTRIVRDFQLIGSNGTTRGFRPVRPIAIAQTTAIRPATELRSACRAVRDLQRAPCDIPESHSRAVRIWQPARLWSGANYPVELAQ